MGELAALLSAILATSKDLVSKRLSSSVDGTVSSFASFLFALPFYAAALVVAWFLGMETFIIAGGFYTWILFRSLSDTFAETCKMHALARGELSAVTSLISLHPVFILFFSPILTGDQLTTTIVVGVLITVLGNIVLLYNPRQPIRRDAFILSLLTAFFFSLNNCFDRLSVQTASPLLSGCLMTLLAGVFLLPTVIRKKGAALELAAHKKPFFIRGGFEISFMVTKLYALQYLQGPEVSAILRLTLLFSVIGGRVMFKELNFVRKTIGALLTILGVAIIVLSHS